MSKEERLLRFACASLQGLLAEGEHPYINTTLEDLTADFGEETSLQAKFAFAAFELAEALNEEWEYRYGKEECNERDAGGSYDLAGRRPPVMGR